MLQETSLLNLYDTGALAWDDPRVDVQTQNWLYLRLVTIPWMEEHPERVQFDAVYINGDCGTFACAGGWYAHMRYGHEVIDAIKRRVERDFLRGLRWTHNHPVFGVMAKGTLAQRAARVDEIIRARLA